jgi:hypothetical protein
LAVALIITSSLILSCSDAGEPMRKRLDSLTTAVDSLSSRVDSLEAEVSMMALLSVDPIKEVTPTEAKMNPAAEGYSVISTKLGPMAFEILETEPDANGSVATVAVGNLTGAFITQISFQVAYESSDTTASDSRHYTDFTVNRNLPPSKWQRVNVQLPDVRPPNLAEVSIYSMLDTRVLYDYTQ